MDERIVELAADQSGLACAECNVPMSAGERAVFCPRCRTPHHLHCWIDHGGCAKKGCKQRVSPDLLPPKEEKPIRASKAPPWVYAAAVALIALIAAGLWVNARRAADERMRTIHVMLPASVDQALWESLVEEYRPRLEAEGKAILLTFVPEIVPVMEGQTIEAGNYDQKLLIQMAAQDAPELVLLSARRIPLYISQGALSPVGDVAARIGELVDPARLSLAELDGVVYGIPLPGQDGFAAVPRTAKHHGEAKEMIEFLVTRLAQRSG